MTRPAPEQVEQVAVLGAGTIGASWAAQFLARGLEVAVWDPHPETADRVRAFVERAWPTLARLGMAAGADPTRFTVHADPAAAVEGASFVQESGPEQLATKRALYARIDQALPAAAVVASSTSGIMPSDLQAGRVGPERYVVGHPFNPPHVVPLVEVVGGRDTDPAVVTWTVAFYAAIGKRPIAVRREVLGHVANRMQVALYREAIHLVLEDVASIDDVDTAISQGPGLRWALMGPHMSHHLGGGAGGMRHLLEHIGPALASWWPDLGRPELTPAVIERLVTDFEATPRPPIAQLEAERDALLVALLETIAATRARLGTGPKGASKKEMGS